MGVVIVTDSGSDFTPQQAARYGITIVPVHIVFGEERLRDGIDIDNATFYRRMNAGEMPKTEPPSIQEFRAAFERIVNAGNEVLCITLSSHISQSHANAVAAAAGFGAAVTVIDSRSASGMEVLLALYGLELAKEGLSAKAIADRIAPPKLKSAVYFAVPDVGHLGRTGRLPKAVVALGSMLNVSLVLKMNEAGAIGPAGQSRSFEKTCEIMVDAIVRSIERAADARIAIVHVEAEETARKLSAGIAAKLGHPPAFESLHASSLTIAANMGPGAVGIFAIVP